MAAIALLIRLPRALAEISHGLGHALLLALLTRSGTPLTQGAWLEGRDIESLIEGLTGRRSGTTDLWMPAPALGRAGHRLVASGGILANLLLAGICTQGLLKLGLSSQADPQILVAEAFLIATLGWSLTACLSIPDWMGVLLGHGDYWACGPAFAVRYRREDAAPYTPLASQRLIDLAEILAREASTRGGQSGGFSILTEKAGQPSIIFDKVVKGKREDIVRILLSRLRSLLKRATKERYRSPRTFEAILLHLRYATGGATHWHNAQPHWYEHYESMVHHRIEGGTLIAREGEVFNMIAHNGDMDGVYLEVLMDGTPRRHYFTQAEARKFLTRAMPWTSSEGNSDSRSVAEWVDFHLTQGLAYKSLRFAWFSAVMDYNEDLAGGKGAPEDLFAWAEAVDLSLVRLRKDPPLSIDPQKAGQLGDLGTAMRQAILSDLAEAIGSTLERPALERLLRAFEHAFFHQDLAWIMRRASRDFVGEFALMVCTTLEPRMGVFCLTQAFSLGYNLTSGEVFGSAEPMGVTTALQQGEPTEEAYQIYLEDGQYALIEFTQGKDRAPIRIFDRASADETGLLNDPLPATSGRLDPRDPATSSNWFAVNGNPRITRQQPTAVEDPIAKDLAEIPYVLKRILHAFDEGGENFETMAHFEQRLFERLADPTRDADTHDLVLFGVDFNQDLIQEFVLALKPLLPGLRVRAENSGNVLKEIKRTRREGIGAYGPGTLFLGVSNSAQTQSTLAVVRKARELVGANQCFVLTQTALNSMSEALGQSYQPDAPLLPNTFVNLSHLSPDGSSARRRAEAATIVPIATQAVLTEILIRLAEAALRRLACPASDPAASAPKTLRLRQDLQQADLLAFREFQSAVYEVEIPNRVGYSSEGEPIDSPDRAALEKESFARAENQVEFVRAYALFASYIVIATVFGVPVFAVLLSPLAFIPGMGILAHGLDAALFLSALWLIHLGIRRIQGRPVFERIGARAEVFIDRRCIARIIERYNATLFSNAPAFITPYFYWADTVQDALHRFGIRAHRGVVTIHRCPDERMGIEEANNAAEENMVLAQLGGIRFNGGEPQSRDKVRKGSRYEDASRPYQTVLSDSLIGLRAKYDGKLSPEALRLINRRLLDLADGLVTEFVIGHQRKEIVNRSVWDVIRWIPGVQWLFDLFLANDIDLRNLTGEADTANQAQIQSTKHPVSPMDSHLETMAQRPSFDALRTPEQPPDKPFAVIAFNDEGIGIHFNQPAALGLAQHREVRLRRGRRSDPAAWISEPFDPTHAPLMGEVEWIEDQEFLVLKTAANARWLLLPTDSLNPEQRAYLGAGRITAVPGQVAA